MKIIKASSTFKYDDHFFQNHGRQKFSVYVKDPDSVDFEAMISEIHPYDDADYVWAYIKYNKQVEFLKGNRIVDKMQMNYFDEEDYESLQEYQNEVIDSVMVELLDMNRNVKPIMVHN